MAAELGQIHRSEGADGQWAGAANTFATQFWDARGTAVMSHGVFGEKNYLKVVEGKGTGSLD